MAADYEETQVRATDGTYRFQSGKSSIALKFSMRESAPTVEEGLVKILIGRIC